MKTKTFDCVEMKRHGAEKVQRNLAGLTTAEELAYWQTGTEELQRKQQEVLRAVTEIEMMPLPVATPVRRGG